MIKVLIVDDSPLMRRVLGAIFTAQEDMTIAFARDGVEALEQIGRFEPDVVTLDLRMPALDGLGCLERIMTERPTPVIVVSSADGADMVMDAMDLGAVDFIPKPSGTISLSVDELAPMLVAKVRAAARARLARRRFALRDQPRQPATGIRLRSRAQGLPSERTPIAGLILVGCSTGGPPALDSLLSGLPEDFSWPIAIAQHMPALFTGALARRLDKLVALSVIEVTRPMPLASGHVYLGKGGADIIVAIRPAGPIITAAPASAEHLWHPSVNRLVSTAMQHLAPSRLMGVLMTGMGNDGAAAMTRLREAGGRTIAEAEETAVVWGMPGELVRAGGAQAVTPLHKIAAQLLDWVG